MDINSYQKKLKENINLLIADNRLDEAKEILGYYENIVKKDVDTYSIKAVIAMMEGNLAVAENILIEGVSIDDKNFDILYNLGYLYQTKGQNRQAVKYYKDAMKYSRNEEEANEVNELLKLLNTSTEVEVEEEIDEMDKYKKKVKENIQSLVEEGLVQEAKTMLEEYGQIVKDDIAYYSLKSVIAMIEGNIDEAEKVLKDGLSLDEKDFDLLYNIAYLYQMRSKNRLAVGFYRKALLSVKSPEQETEIHTIIATLEELYKEEPIDIRFSIVIPTRQRHETLKYAIDTCLAQDYDNYELIICDNNSSYETREIVEGFSSPKIKYIRSEETLCMSDNWDLAISHAKGEYVIIIGDDDGLLLHALRELDQILEKTKAKVIRWETVIYNWPNSKFKNHANLLSIPLARHSVMLDSKDIIQKILQRQYPYNVLPMLYNSVIHRDVINSMYEINNRIFKSVHPDIYSGFWIALLNEKYISLQFPITIGGISGSSNGIATIHNTKKNEISQEFYTLNNTSAIKCNTKVPDIPTISAAVMCSYYDARQHIAMNNWEIEVNEEQVINWYMNELIMRLLKVEDEKERAQLWTKYFNQIKDKYQTNQQAINWFFNNYPKESPEEWFKSNTHLVASTDKPQGFSNGVLNLSADEFNVTNVYEAAELCEKILYYKTGITWNEPIEN